MDHFKRKLLAQRRALLGTVAGVETELLGLQDEVEIEEGERGQEETMSRLLDRLDQHGLEEVAAIDAALHRIGRGEYGRCERCGGAIPTERLEALPTATMCVACAEAQERKTEQGGRR